MNIIHSVFSLVLKFRSQLISQPWGPAGGPHGAEHPNFALMQQSYNTFKYYSHFLFKGEPSLPPPTPPTGRWAAGRHRGRQGPTRPLTVTPTRPLAAPPTVVTKLVNRGYQPHLEDFLLRINFNSYYQDA